MKITLGKIEFTVSPVESGLREALLADPIMAQGVWRDVYRWDAAAQTGSILVTTTGKDAAVPLGNGLSFFIPRLGANGIVTKNDASSARMAARFLDAVGAKQILDVITAINRLVNLPYKSLPLDVFAPINPAASYLVRMHVDYGVVQLRDAGRNLTAHLFLPGQVAFHHEVTAITDAPAYEALIAQTPALAQLQPAFIVPPRTDANLALRRIALGRRLEDMRPMIEKMAGPDRKLPDGAEARTFARLVAEWRALTPQQKARTPAR